MMKPKLKPEPIVKQIFHDPGTQYLIQQELQDIYNSLDKIKQQPVIIYRPQEDLESLEEDNSKEELIQEEICYENI